MQARGGTLMMHSASLPFAFVEDQVKAGRVSPCRTVASHVPQVSSAQDDSTPIPGPKPSPSPPLRGCPLNPAGRTLHSASRRPEDSASEPATRSQAPTRRDRQIRLERRRSDRFSAQRVDPAMDVGKAVPPERHRPSLLTARRQRQRLGHWPSQEASQLRRWFLARTMRIRSALAPSARPTEPSRSSMSARVL